MLRQVFVYFQNQRIYFTHFGKALDEESFSSVFKKLQQEAFTRGRDPNAVGSYDFYKYRISFIASAEKEIVYIFVTDLTDAVDNIKTQLQICRREFLELFESVLGAQFDKETFEVFHPTIEKIHKELRPKISLVGFSGVGKTTITKLIRAEEIPMEHVPTITGEIGTIKIGKLSFALWDFAGQEQFSFLWNKFVKGSDAVLLITDSSLENVEKSRFFTELVKQEAPHAHLAIIGNKQDLPGAMPSTEIERILGGIHAYSMVATDPANRDKMITIIADILEMSAEVSPLLKPLIDRDKKMAMAEGSLMGGDFQGAYRLFNEIADLCLELGDDSLSSEFHQKADKVKGYLSQMGQTAPAVGKAPATAPAPPAGTATMPLIFEGEDTEPIPITPIKPPAPGGMQIKPISPPPGPPGPMISLLKIGTPPPVAGSVPAFKPVGFQKPPPIGPGSPIVKPLVPKPPPVAPTPVAHSHEGGIVAPLVFNPPPDDLAPDETMEPAPPKPIGQLKIAPTPVPAFKPGPPKQILLKPPTVFPSQPSAEFPVTPPQTGAAPVIPQLKPPAFAKPTPVAPLIKPPAFAQPTPPAPSTSTPIGADDMGGADTATMKRQINATLMDLKIKVANMNKYLLEIEMKNLTGEMPDAEFNQKKQRAEAMKTQLQQQMAESQELFKSMG